MNHTPAVCQTTPTYHFSAGVRRARRLLSRHAPALWTRTFQLLTLCGFGLIVHAGQTLR